MSSELRVNKLTSRSGVGTVSFNDSGLIITGIATAAVLDITGSATAASLSITGNATLGSATISGVLSYDDVTNVDSVGIITARSDLSIADKIIHTGDTNTAIRFPAADTITAETAGSEIIRIDSSGNVLVGTTDATIYNNSDPDSEGIVLRNGEVIDIARKGDLQLTLNRQTNDGQHIGFFRSGVPKSYISTRNDAFCIDVNSSERVRITSAGNFGIGTDNPQGKLTVSNGSAGLELNPNSEQAIVSYNRATSAYTPVGLQGSVCLLYTSDAADD